MWYRLLPILVIVLLGSAAAAHAERLQWRYLSAGEPLNSRVLADDSVTKRFEFADFEARLRSDGYWVLDGELKHRQFRCGEYQVALRFGRGSAACEDVKWLSNWYSLNRQTQCNHASLPHSREDVDDALVDQFDNINCAETRVQCEGSCK